MIFKVNKFISEANNKIRFRIIRLIKITKKVIILKNVIEKVIGLPLFPEQGIPLS